MCDDPIKGMQIRRLTPEEIAESEPVEPQQCPLADDEVELTEHEVTVHFIGHPGWN